MTKGKNRHVQFKDVYDMDNLRKAEKEARKGKSKHYGVRKFEANLEKNLLELQEELKNRTFATPMPTIEERFCDKKTRVLSKVQFKYHVAHHALMRVIMPTLMKYFHYESAASIKGRGIHYAAKHMVKYINRYKNKGDIFHAQLDFVKCYHHVGRQLLFNKLCKTFTNEGIRWMLHDIIWSLRMHNGMCWSDGTSGVGIGLFPIQPLVNYHISALARYVESHAKVKVITYCDNIQLASRSSIELQKGIDAAKYYCKNILKQPIHTNVGIQKLSERHPIDFVGYKYYGDYIHIRTESALRFYRKFNHTSGLKRYQILVSYRGWLKFSNSLGLWKSVTNMKSFSEFEFEDQEMINGKRVLKGELASAMSLVNKKLIVTDFELDVPTDNGNKCLVQVKEGDTLKKFFTGNTRMISQLKQIRKHPDGFPFMTTLLSVNYGGGEHTYNFV